MQMAESRGKWLLVSIGSSQCADACQKNLYKLRQVKKAIGQEHKRINKYFFLTDKKALDSFSELLIDYSGMEVIQPSGDNYMEFLSIFSVDGHKIEDGIYIVDPLVNYMMMYSKDEEPMKILKDMERLLKVSKIG
jgi:cytochrome oxidase Cu insertion factor (SCO1/SenC/PrrC family)